MQGRWHKGVPGYDIQGGFKGRWYKGEDFAGEEIYNTENYLNVFVCAQCNLIIIYEKTFFKNYNFCSNA